MSERLSRSVAPPPSPSYSRLLLLHTSHSTSFSPSPSPSPSLPLPLPLPLTLSFSFSPSPSPSTGCTAQFSSHPSHLTPLFFLDTLLSFFGRNLTPSVCLAPRKSSTSHVFSALACLWYRTFVLHAPGFFYQKVH